MKRYLCAGFVIATLMAFASYRALADDATTKPSDTGDIKVLVDFENDADSKLVKPGDDNVTVAIDPSHATTGSKSLKVTAQKGHDFGPVVFLGDAVKGWDTAKYKYIAFDCTTDQDVAEPVILEVMDAKSTNFKTRASIDENVPALAKGKVTIFAKLEDFKRNDKTGPMDLTQITKFRILFTTKDMKDDLVTYIDNVRLTSEPPK